MIKRSGVVDSALHGAPGLVGKSLEPEDPRERDASHHPLVKPTNRREATEHAFERALDVVPRPRLISPVMKRSANYSIAYRQTGRVAPILR
jgi:hypothetical protein